jgi:hypothetical protein
MMTNPLATTTSLLLLMVPHGQAMVDVSRHNSMHYEKTAALEASSALVTCDDQLVKGATENGLFFGSTSRRMAQMHLVGVATREQIIHTVLQAVFPDYCQWATTANAGSGSAVLEPSSSTTVTQQHELHEPSPFEAITGFHFGPIGTCDRRMFG